MLVAQFWVLIFETKRIGVALIYREAVSFPWLGVSLVCPQTLLACSNAIRHIFFTELSYLPPTEYGKSNFLLGCFPKESQEALIPRACHRLLSPTWQPIFWIVTWHCPVVGPQLTSQRPQFTLTSWKCIQVQIWPCQICWTFGSLSWKHQGNKVFKRISWLHLYF